MRQVFESSADVEKNVKASLGIPDFMMMENAAIGMADFIKELCGKENLSEPSILILCGQGNNGGDGFALSRHLYADYSIQLVAEKVPYAKEALVQYEICHKLGLLDKVLTKSADIIVDCIYGIGFHGDLEPAEKLLIENANKSKAIKIACDVPSGLRKNGSTADGIFMADYTLTMGVYKTALFSDMAKAACGKVELLNIGISRTDFEKFGETSIYHVESDDIQLPYRKNPSVHKGSFGHTVVFAGEKSGAAILAATSALKFGTGLSTLLKTINSNLLQFKISPELMISQQLPKKATCLVVGSGLGYLTDTDSDVITNWFTSIKNPSIVLDADFFNQEHFVSLLNFLNGPDNARIILTPHIAELSRIMEKVLTAYTDLEITAEEITVENLSKSTESKIKIGQILNKLFPKTVVVMKSANTFVAFEGKTYIITQGTPALAKAGSGDVLAGMTGALLAQGYDAKTAALTAVFAHGKASTVGEVADFALSPEVLLENISKI